MLAELAQKDFLTLNERGRIRAEYPFSAVPTPHRIRITGCTEVWSMCAIDALGIPAMLGSDVLVTSVDSVTVEPITVTTSGAAVVWEPAGSG